MNVLFDEIESAINELDEMRLKDILDSIPPRKYSKYIQWLTIGVMCYGNITLGECKERLKCQSQPH